jgi:hypothetical protein
MVLLFDLAEDGCLGKVKFVAPHHLAKASLAATTQQSAKVYFKVDRPPPDELKYSFFFQTPPPSSGIFQYHNLSGFYCLGSSGGLPL